MPREDFGMASRTVSGAAASMGDAQPGTAAAPGASGVAATGCDLARRDSRVAIVLHRGRAEARARQEGRAPICGTRGPDDFPGRPFGGPIDG